MRTQELNLIGVLLTADVVEIDDIMVGRNFEVTEPMQPDDADEWNDDFARFKANYVDDDDHEEFKWVASGKALVEAVYTGNAWVVNPGEDGEFKVRCYRLKLLRPEHKDEPWLDDYVQFARLLAEIKMAGLSAETLAQLRESMDLDSDQIQSLFDRAEERFEEIKRA